jgi:hypothetical protein
MAHEERYRTVMASDVARNGMYLELWDRTTETLALSVFYSDTDGSMEFERFRTDVPFEVESWFQEEARRRLPPLGS